MDSVCLIQLLNGTLPPSEFQRSVIDEVQNWVLLQRERGRVAPIHLAGPPPVSTIGRKKAARLLNAVLEGAINLDTLAYVADALLLSPSIEWESEEILGLFETLCDNQDGYGPDLGEIKLKHDELCR